MAYTPIDPTVLTGVLNNQGTLATEVTSSAILSEITSGTTQVAITYSDTPLFDAFGRLRTSDPTTLFDGKLTLDAAPQFLMTLKLAAAAPPARTAVCGPV